MSISPNEKNSKKKKTPDKIKGEFPTFTLAVLDWMYDAMENLAAISLSKKAGYQLLYDRTGSHWDRRRVSQYFAGLKQRGYIEIKGSSMSESFVFTDKAKFALVEKIVAKLGANEQFRFLSFDIPEDMRRNRNGFRRFIKKLGFVQVQKSLWVINKNVGDFVEQAAYKHDVEKYVIYIVSQKTDIDGILHKKFLSKK